MAAAANVDQQQFRINTNRRGFFEKIYFDHLNLSDLRNNATGLEHGYLFRDDIPRYPQPSFSATRLRHDTDSEGLKGIKKDKGFKNPFDAPLLWWSLDIGDDEITRAAEKKMKTNPSAERVKMKPSDLKEFATSPAFQESSRLGAFRFTFPLEKVLQEYSQQFCDGKEPMMRAFRTYLYKQEVMYVVLVHRPRDKELFFDYPLLTDTPNPVCAYRDGGIIWRAQAMCNTHEWTLMEQSNEQLVETVKVDPPKYFVWDHVSVALHVGNQVLQFDDDDLCNSLKFCSKGKPFIGRKYDKPKERDDVVRELWPICPALQISPQVEEAEQLLQNFSLR